MVKKLLEERSKIKKRKPTFKRQQTNQFAKLKNTDGWRKPKGHQSKMKLGRKGHRKMPSVGFGSPSLVRGLNKDGLVEVIVYNVSDLKKVDMKIQIPIISKNVGGRKRLDILKEAKKLGLSFGNVLDIDKTIDKLTKKPKSSTTKKKKTKSSTVKKEQEDKTQKNDVEESVDKEDDAKKDSKEVNK